ncbi:MAG: ATPase, T2SS/T4P/T4SS family [Myxococcota bacterium]
MGPDQTQRPRATVGLIDGSSKIGYLKAFDPTSERLDLRLPAKTADGKIEDSLETYPPEKLAFVAFHKGRTDEHVMPEEREEYCVHVPGDTRFVITASPETVDDRLGFYGYPISNYSWFERVYFFQHGVNAVEDQAPIGSIMVDSGLIRDIDVQEGLEEQAALQNTRLGQILVEQGSVSSEAVEDAVKDLGRRDTELDDEESMVVEDEERGRLRLGEVLVEAGLADEADVERALDEQQRRRGVRLGQVLVQMGVVSERDISRTLAKKFNLEFVDLDKRSIDPSGFEELPMDLVKRHELVPVESTEDELVLAMSDPLAMEALDLLRFSLDKKLVEVVATPSQIDRHLRPIIDDVERQKNAAELEQILRELQEDADHKAPDTQSDVTVAGQQQGAVARMVNQIIIDGFREKASDIHIEPNGPENDVQVRFRVDGVLQSYRSLPASQRAPLVARIKIMSNLDITERRKPQDGKIKFKIGERQIELRVATVPTTGRDEDVVLRILAGGKPMPLERLELTERNLRELRNAVERPYGMILAVGPTGSGKTTTLHAMLNSINTVERKIWTAEDPVEITQDGLRQVQVNPKIDFTFANALRSFLRADPDVIMVGEMRDPETATIGIEASLTGHLVFSTLHTNSAPETVTRLVDMGLDPFSFADALIAILAQRLARRLCSSCKESYEATPDERAEIEALYGAERLEQRLDGEPLVLYQSPGCPQCDGKGYSGRVGIHELLISNENVRASIQRRENIDDLRRTAQQSGMRTLVQDGIEKAIDGLTDLRQVFAVCSY